MADASDGGWKPWVVFGTTRAPAPTAAPTPETAALEVALREAGLDVDDLLARLGSGGTGLGGPYVALSLDGARGADEELLELQRREGLQTILKSLPTAVPLEAFVLESRFGVRPDPFNRRQALHAGIDLVAPFKTPVFNTAPGTVVFAGVRDSYGRMVEIDHGFGVSTRYAHLHRITVARGQRLDRRTQIGLLGSTGRSTGPHVHYEVLVNGVAQDPEKFIQLGRAVE